MYQWWVFVHLVGVFGFLAAHGVSMTVTFKLRTERDPKRISDLLALSGTSIRYFYYSTGLLLLGGIVAGFLGHWWAQGWIWAAIVVLVLTSMAMLGVARPYYRRVGLVARAMAGGSTAVPEEQFDSILRSRRPDVVMAIGIVGLGLILYFMLFKPTFGYGGASAAPAPVASASTGPSGPTLQLSAKGFAFNAKSLTAPAGQALQIVFNNQDGGVPHNIAIYTDSSGATVLFRGSTISGPKTVTYHVPALQPGTYFFRCDVHPSQMTGSLVVK